jgi:hypothetical protein
VSDHEAETMDTPDKHNNFYNDANPWSPPLNENNAVFHTPVNRAETPLVRSFTGTLEIGFLIGTKADINVSALLKIFLSFTLKTDPEFRILPLEGGNQSIEWLNGIPTSKEGIDL